MPNAKQNPYKTLLPALLLQVQQGLVFIRLTLDRIIALVTLSLSAILTC